MTEQEIQDAVAALYDGTADTPEETDDDYLTRRRLINRFIRLWENNQGYEWTELWTNTSVSSTGATLTVATDDNTYAAPTAFRKAGGYVFLYDGTTLKDTYKVIKPHEAQNQSLAGKYAYFRGNRSTGYTLVLNPIPTANINGYTLNYDYYKAATPVSATSTVVEMNDPEYIVNGVVAELHKADSNFGGYETAMADAQECLKGMEIRQVMDANYQGEGIEDMTEGFGV